MFPRLTGRGAGTAGLTLLELVVAILVLSVGAMAALRASDQARVGIGGATPRGLAQIVVRNRIEEMRLFGPRAGQQVSDMGGQSFTVLTTTAPTAGGLVQVTVTARSAQGAGASLIAWVPVQGTAKQ